MISNTQMKYKKHHDSLSQNSWDTMLKEVNSASAPVLSSSPYMAIMKGPG